MKITNYLLIVLMAGVLALVGCGKSNKQGAAARQPGVVDLTELTQAFSNATPEITASFEKLRFATRYGKFDEGLVELEKLSALPNATDDQKKAINEVIEQVKTAIKVRSAAAPPQ